jgi:hypothetical protein
MMAHDYGAARAQLTQAKSIYAGYGQTYYYFAQLHFAEKDYASAAAALDTAFKLHYVGLPELYADVTRALEANKNFVAAAHLIENYLIAKSDGYKPGAGRADHMPVGDDNLQLLARLPVLWARAGDKSKATLAAHDLLLADPQASSQVEMFLRDLQRNDISKWISAPTLLNVPSAPSPPRIPPLSG